MIKAGLLKKTFECPLCGSMNLFNLCSHCLGKIATKPIVEMSNLNKYQDIAIIDTLGGNRQDLREYRDQLIASM